MTRTATCCCGGTSITVTGDPSLNGVCHCNDCKRRTGTAFGWNTYFPDDQVIEKSGQWQTYEPKSQPGQMRYACKDCASVMWWTNISAPSAVGMPAGIFQNPPLPEPKGSYQHADHMPWFHVPDEWSRVS